MDALTQIQTQYNILYHQYIQSIELSNTITTNNYNTINNISIDTGISPDHTAQYTNDTITRTSNDIMSTYIRLHQLIDSLPNDHTLNDYHTQNSTINELNQNIVDESNELYKLKQRAELQHKRVSHIIQLIAQRQIDIIKM